MELLVGLTIGALVGIVLQRRLHERRGCAGLAASLDVHNAVLGWVSRDGVTLLPPNIRAKLDIPERGGGIVIWKRSDHPYVELLTDEQAMAELRGGQEKREQEI